MKADLIELQVYFPRTKERDYLERIGLGLARALKADLIRRFPDDDVNVRVTDVRGEDDKP